MNKQILAKTHWNNPNGFHSRENSKSAVCIQLPFPNTQNKQKRHQRKVQTLNPFYFCFHRTAIRSLPPVHAQPPLTLTSRWPQGPPRSPENSQERYRRHHSNHKENNKKAWAPTPAARARLESQKNKCSNVRGCQAIRTVIKNPQILNKKTMGTERGIP